MNVNGSIPYASATAGGKAQGEIERLLRGFGAEHIGWAKDYVSHQTTLWFVYRQRQVQLRVSAQGWANMYLEAHPWHARRTVSQEEYEQRWLTQGEIAVISILRDWIKGQLTAVEAGLMQFDHVFLPYMICEDNLTLAEQMDRLPLRLLEGGG